MATDSTLEKLKVAIAAIQTGDYEHFGFDPNVDKATAIGLLTQWVNGLAWQPWARKEASRLLASLND
jgi:hypothetical protein